MVCACAHAHVCVCVGGGEGGSLGGQNLVWGQLMNRGKANF